MHEDPLVDDCSLEYKWDHPFIFFYRQSWHAAWRKWRTKRCHRRQHRAPVMLIPRPDGRHWHVCRNCQHAYTSEAVDWSGRVLEGTE